MERTKTNIAKPEEGKVLWKKIGGGSFMLGNRIIKPGQTFWAFPHEIPKSFRDVVISSDPNAVFEAEAKKDKEVVKSSEVKKLEFKIQPRKNSKLWYDIVDSEGKILNEKALKKEAAEKLVKDLLK